jgi:tight adherence protein B
MSGQIDQIIAVLGGLGVLLGAAGLAIRAEHRILEARLRTFLTSGRRVIAEAEVVVTRRVLVDSRHVVLRRMRLGASSHLLAQAGWTMSSRRFLLIQLLCGGIGLTLARVALGRIGADPADVITFALILGGVALVGRTLPRLLLLLKRKRRLEKIETQLPIGVDTIANAIQAGLSLPQAIDVVARDMPAPLGTELQVVVRELALGMSLEQALDEFAARVPLRDVEIFVAAVHIQYRTGGNLSDILRSIANTIRERLRIRGEIRVLTAQQRMAGVIVTALPFFIVAAVRFLSPAYFEKLLEPGTMRIMLIVAGFGMLSGAYWLHRIAQIEV